MATVLRDWERFTGTDLPVNGATVELRAASLTQPNNGSVVASTTTDSNGKWEFTGLADGNYDVKIIYLGRVRRRYGYSAFSNEIELPTGIEPRQLLVNGGFEINQRGGTVTASGAYAHDRWQLTESGGDAVSIADETANIMPDSRVAAICNCTYSAGAGATQYAQILKIAAGEPHHGLLGKQISLRISVKQATAVASACKAFITTDGTGGTTTLSSFHGTNTNWESLDVVNVTVPADATTITVGIKFYATVVIYADNAMLVNGPTAWPYRYVHPADDMVRCLRYYELAYPGNQGLATGAFTYEYTLPYMAVKPVSPTVTRNGAFGVTNSAQPTSFVRGDDRRAMSYVAAITGAGGYFFGSGSAAVNFSVEANP
jgi:hypothetical protein